jgi:radical SAM protein with 4Fe4S-binding SPASM domain
MTKAALRDSLRIARHLTLRRVANVFLLQLSYRFSKIFRTASHAGAPYALSIEPTTACNLGCPACPSGLKAFTRPTGKLDPGLHRGWLDQVAKNVFYINYYFQGEPFLHPQFLDLIRDAKRKRIYTATSTNAHFIDAKKAADIVDSGLDRLIISIDGLTQETYSSYRVHGQLEKVVQAAKHLVEAKKRAKTAYPFLIFQFLVVKANEHEIPELHKLAKEIGIDEIRFKTAQVYDYQNGNELIPENAAYSRYIRNADGTYRMKYRGRDDCWRMWSSAVITWDGKMVPCCFDKDASHALGSLKESTFRDIWKSASYRSFRSQILEDRNAIDICTNCTEGAQVWVD